ncbi:YceI family protein [Komagataeibacter sp. AV436]|uniref:YceI family protein n=1 Tax=Komagataeibacter melomenusus TaxID=2766578 RepID=A0ABX2A9X0_9PROT|nr:YceI family protein [Komagataeibacter melomenusus]MBV1829704.1 YceI family protein [Komagataeibacter melomenusus]NPC65095.1 YceI family protein [Komagataeibacter melomenusus]
MTDTALRPAPRLARLLVMALACLGLPALARPVHATPQHLTLTPDNTAVLLHASSVIGAMDGQFGKVSGTLDYDLSRQTCHVDLTMDATTVHMDTILARKAAQSGGMLGTDRWPTARYVGDCRPHIVNGGVASRMVGHLTLRGQTHPMMFDTRMDFTGNTLSMLDSTGTFDGRKWGMSTMLHTVRQPMRTETRITLPNPSR